MNRELLKTLRDKLKDHYVDIYWRCVSESPNPRPNKQLEKAIFEWKKMCQSLDIRQINDSDDFDPPGVIFEDFVVVNDPDPGGFWLKISHETAMKILTLGIP